MKKYINHEDMINTNCSNVLDVIQKSGNVSRKEITELTGLSWGGMTKIVNRLLEKGYIAESKGDPGVGGGRIPGIISINRQKNFVVGLDINKTGFKGTVMNLAGEWLKNYSRKVTANTKEQMLKEIISFVKAITGDFPLDAIIAIGVAMQGEVDSKNGISVKYPGIKDWTNVPIKDILENSFGTDVYIEHDPDCILRTHLNKALSKNIALFRIDESIGMAVSLDGKILKSNSILEVAHNTVIPGGKICRCGLKGCLEAYIPADADDGNAVGDLLLPLSVTIKNTANLFNSDTVILTGDLTPQLKTHKDELAGMLKNLHCSAAIVFSENTDDAVSGVALYAIRQAINSLEI